MKLILIEWLDSKAGPEGWEYLEDIEKIKPISCKSVGFVIDEENTYKTIAPTIGGGQVLGRITIPACSITNFQIISE